MVSRFEAVTITTFDTVIIPTFQRASGHLTSRRQAASFLTHLDAHGSGMNGRFVSISLTTAPVEVTWPVLVVLAGDCLK